ncbi:type II CRISPR RNA-guided endonuclease Cas9 [Woodsholea maritima]|uniref:type II CRISPR RNA-guided endonuclease Cas9 n=1 Tax=Woodsholea maritima TaxID=240237 RepID=UPI000378DA9F|nr:type II CRISPR RNA-guided endonuclease Cas9 [Woodsholea maritima]
MTEKYKPLLFAFDLGTNSIGYWVYALNSKGEPESSKGGGVRIFSDGRDPKSKASLAVARREARAMSRRRDRYIRRRKALLRTLSEYGLMPRDAKMRRALVQETGDIAQKSGGGSDGPYELRARALDEKLPLEYIGRAVFHLNQRRGFKSNRKTDRKDNDLGKIGAGVRDLEAQIMASDARTYGEWLAKRRRAGQTVRLRAGSDLLTAEGYAFYPSRALLEAEFKAIWAAQAQYYPDILTSEREKHVFDIIFYQRPLKPPQVGKCAFNPKETRLAKAHPVFQAFRLYKEVNELEIVLDDLSHQKLNRAQRDKLIWLLRQKKKLSFAKLRTELKLPRTTTFNKESETRKDLVGDEVYVLMADAKRFGGQWADFTLEEQWAILTKLKEEEDPERLLDWLQAHYKLDDDQAIAIIDAPLPQGYGRLGLTALSAMLDALKEDVIPEAEAAKRCGYNHSRLGFESEAGEDCLPPYQEVMERHIPPGSGDEDVVELELKDSLRDGLKEGPIPIGYDLYKGRITNPTVHIGLNQLRRLVNDLLVKHGKPQSMVLELARDLQMSEKQKTEYNKAQAKNRREAEARGSLLQEMGQRNNGSNRVLLKLWEELNPKDPEGRVCIYSGQAISASMLFSGEVDIDHILPWSRTLDDSKANLILCISAANRQKRNRAPAEVTEWQSHYDEILARAQILPKNKRWRFAADAMARFEGEEDFVARQLTDTQYLSRLAKEYLECLYPFEEADEHGELKKRNHVWVTPGRLTEMLRRNWGLNSLLGDQDHAEVAQPKNRQDHRHHAIDAAVIGVTTRALLKHISGLARTVDSQNFDYAIKKIIADNPPWPSFREDLKAALQPIVVSHKPDHGRVSQAGYKLGKGQTAGQLHNDTAYGPTQETDAKGNPIVVRRKAFNSLVAKDIPNVRDERLQAELYSAIEGLQKDKDIAEALAVFQKTHKQFKNIRRVRVAETLSTIPIRDSDGKVFKGFKGDSNYRYDVWETLDGKWHCEVVTMFDVHQRDWTSPFHKDHPTARRVLRLQQNDMVAYNHPDKGYCIARVVKFGGNGQIFFAPHNEANTDNRNRDKDDPFKFFSKTASGLKAIQCRQIRISPSGQIFDPGPQDQESKAQKRQIA